MSKQKAGFLGISGSLHRKKVSAANKEGIAVGRSMSKRGLAPISAAIMLAVSLVGCSRHNDGEEVISKRYVHRYGYQLSQADWDNHQYPGQEITTLRNGVTVTSSYENGVLHGPTTHTHPHSQTIQHFYLYHFGTLKKAVEYDVAGVPMMEKIQLSPHRHSITRWYADGTPMSSEDFADDELLEGKYFTVNHEVDSVVERGEGLRTCRTRDGVLLSKDYIHAGYLQKQEAFYPTGTLESVTTFYLGKKNGERRRFTDKSEPLAVETWVDDSLYGKATYYLNGLRQAEVYYIGGAKTGVETRYIDGKIVEEKISWNQDKRHGPTEFYVGDNVVKTEWYYEDKMVSQKRFEELELLEQGIVQAGFNADDAAYTPTVIHQEYPTKK